ncbi:CvpA family protein [Prolixibacteraceae bacterium Z1-6]|uniref:CvpA family protein n=1 Tax=Draconibacterium aestuarii TaxID=2998507 RepID=A0A9X3F8A2_9BACT|nr:CvpA family protein [Prolixibacteraceae bacterium Z1-6]
MNYIDIVLGILLIFAAISGFRKGLITELASLAALILGIWGAIKFSYLTTDFLIDNFKLETEYMNLISFAITFVVIVILVHIVGNTVTKLVETVMLGFVNKMAGLVFGVVKAALILSIILVVFDKIDDDVHILNERTKENSWMYEPIRSFAPTIFPFIDVWEINLKEKEKPKTHVV